jgi:hypothetical protein
MHYYDLNKYREFLGCFDYFSETGTGKNVFPINKKLEINRAVLFIDRVYSGEDEFSVLYNLKSAKGFSLIITQACLIDQENGQWVINMNSFRCFGGDHTDENKVLTFEPLPAGVDELIMVIMQFRYCDYGFFYEYSPTLHCLVENFQFPEDLRKVFGYLYNFSQNGKFLVRPVYIPLKGSNNESLHHFEEVKDPGFFRELFSYFEDESESKHKAEPPVIDRNFVYNIITEAMDQPQKIYLPEPENSWVGGSGSDEISALFNRQGKFRWDIADMMLHIKSMTSFPLRNPEKFTFATSEGGCKVLPKNGIPRGRQLDFGPGYSPGDEIEPAETDENWAPTEYGSHESRDKTRQIYEKLQKTESGIRMLNFTGKPEDIEEMNRIMMFEIHFRDLERKMQLESYNARNSKFYRHWLEVSKRYGLGKDEE